MQSHMTIIMCICMQCNFVCARAYAILGACDVSVFDTLSPSLLYTHELSLFVNMELPACEFAGY